MEGGEEVNISYEVLFELLRREKNREELQKLPADFYANVLTFIHQKQKNLTEATEEKESEKARNELSSTKKVVADLFERREKKIIFLALNKVRTQSAIMDASAILKEEKHFFDKLTHLLAEFRIDVLSHVNTSSLLEFVKPPLKAEEKKVVHEEKNYFEKKPEHPQLQQATTDPQKKKVKFISPVPKFLGKNMEVYGPYEQEQIVEFPENIANILIKKGKVEEISG